MWIGESSWRRWFRRKQKTKPHVIVEFSDSQYEKSAAINEWNILPKPWSLRDEVNTSACPKNSFLETSLQHNTTVHPKYVLWSTIREQNEDVIKQRIVNGLSDDVVVAPPEH